MIIHIAPPTFPSSPCIVLLLSNLMYVCRVIIYTVPSKSIGAVRQFLAVESRHFQLWLKYEYELQNVTFYYWVIQPLDVFPDKKFSTFRVHPSIWCEHKYWDSFLTGLSKWSDVSCFIHSSDIKSRECVVSVITITSAFNDDTQTRMKMRELTLREKQAMWMLKEKRKSIRATAKTKSVKKSRVWKPPATPAANNYLIGWENNSSLWQTNHKSCEN